MYELNKDRDYKVVITSSAMGMLSLLGYALYLSTKAAMKLLSELLARMEKFVDIVN